MEEFITVLLIVVLGIAVYGPRTWSEVAEPERYLRQMTPSQVQRVMADGVFSIDELNAWSEGRLE